MLILHHFPLSPGGRKLRLHLAEKNQAFDESIVKPWALPDTLVRLGPSYGLPILTTEDGDILAGDQPIAEYLEEIAPSGLLGDTPVQRADIRRIVLWLDRDFRQDVIETLLTEKLFRRLSGLGEPVSSSVRTGHAAIHKYLEDIAQMTQRHGWLAGERMSLADLTAAAYLSTIDYLGDVPWDRHGEARQWYARMKSRPSFRPLLADRVAGIPPAPHYANLDF